MKYYSLAIAMSLWTLSLAAQETNTTDSTLVKLVDELKILKKIKVSGYLQAQYQRAQEKGIKYPGGDFGAQVDNRFSMRRARLKVAYDAKPFEWVLVTENTERGISLHDIYGSYTYAPLHLKYTAGLFPRPFGFEQSYSTANHEGPERARFSTTMLPAEADLGMKLSYSGIKPLQFELGAYNGTATAADFDSFKDWVARISFQKNIQEFHISGGVSYYEGGVYQGNSKRYEVTSDLPVFVLADSLVFSKGSKLKRQYLGADVQLSFKNPLGQTTFRAEWIQGTQPGTSSSSDSPKSNTLPAGDSYLRNFNAFCGYFLQKLGSSNWMLVVKYDWYDPNTDIKENELGAANSGTTATDVQFNTLGLGLNYYYKNMYFMLYYDMIKNETTNQLSGYHEDIKDNVLTIRTQFKF